MAETTAGAAAMRWRPHRYVAHDRCCELFARDYGGGGLPLLLMHGLTRNSADFEPLAAHLAPRYRLIVPDQRGRGLSPSDPQPENYRPDIYCRDMLALLDSLKIERASLIGTSLGGLMAMMMAAMEPARVGPVVLNDIGPELAQEGLARIGSYVGVSEPFIDWDEAAARCEETQSAAFPGFGQADWIAFAQRTCREHADGRITYAYDPAIAEAFAADPAGSSDLWPLFEALDDRPVLVLRGALSDLLTAQTVAEMKRRHRGPFSHVEVGRRGHAPLLDEPDALVAIEAFLAEYVQ